MGFRVYTYLQPRDRYEVINKHSPNGRHVDARWGEEKERRERERKREWEGDNEGERKRKGDREKRGRGKGRKRGLRGRAGEEVGKGEGKEEGKVEGEREWTGKRRESTGEIRTHLPHPKINPNSLV